MINAAEAVGRTVVPDNAGGEIDLAAEWRWAPLATLVSERVAVEVGLETDRSTLGEIAERHDVPLQPNASTAEILVELYEKLVEPTIIEPTPT